ncbi:nose resistant to fluoxetine protein 6 [Papilio machaon]|uniref:nose resistant to fluoxetine protein 6 n=1 Tax=Papilio machaon TaxID=76193 RepID=UPI001E66569A|nr:nose resistant to fluoxetine protein 6 [Papilio machaon]
MNFSLRKNWNDLVNEESADPRRNRLKVLRGVRAITNCLMILAHVFFIYTTGFIDSPHAVEKTYESFQYHLVYNGLLIVQIFFLMSAFLQSYLMHLRSEVSPIQWSELPMIMFARWWRLSPTYAVLLAFSGTWMRHLGTGPLWKMYVGDSMAAQCRRFWPQHLFYINNYIAGDTACQVQTWHIAVDMQLFVLTMLVYMCTRGRGRSWQLALGLLLLTGLLGPPLHVWLQDLQALTMVTPEFFRRLADTRTFRLLHILCHNNLICYVVGLATGSLVYRLQKDNVDLSKYKRWGMLSWCLVPGIACLFLTGRVFFAEGAELPGGVSGGVVWRALYAATLRLAMAAIVSMLVVTLTMRFCG